MPPKPVDYTEITKSDLRNGMFVKTRDGEIYTVLFNTGFMIYKNILLSNKNKSFLDLDDYADDLSSSPLIRAEHDIVEVFRADRVGNIGHFENYVSIWERPEPQEMTQAQVEEALGYKIKLVTDSNTTYKEPTA